MKIAECFASGKAVCEEFSRHVFADSENLCLLINITHAWTDTLINRLKKLNFSLVSKIEMYNTTTIVFQHNEKRKIS